ncbi:sigma-70 family RNA polymerase sigma factor [Acetobacterium paludosum]|uniref:Sigma-70 family RNA polymerase sigma factor n=1 Tax=Acetobacterium paludosum TaxID=52693 RepID=A0A923HZ67_9FIRM|nr:sigma-70 family RNA polymerase sigma factor [Acetobacterium paludosum]MBC3887248.1 sigma-70 family RNA polymerase sigma factor [Acetobacterium paludosum]
MTNEELVQAYQSGDKEAMTTIIENNTGLVYFHAKRYHQLSEMAYLDFDDIVQNGYMGLMSAVEGFSPLQGFKFSTYASQSIKRNIYTGLLCSTPWENKRDPKSKLCQVISAYEVRPGTENAMYIDLIEDEDAENAFHNTMIEMDRIILRTDLFKVLNTVFELHENKRTFIILKYGLTGKPHTYNEIAGIYGLSIEAVRRNIVNGLREIKSSAIGIQLKEKYQVEYALNDRLERLTKVEYKDPAYYVDELEKLRALLGA